MPLPIARHWLGTWSIAQVLIALLFLSSGSPCVTATEIRLVDVTEQTGIAFRHNDGSCGKYYIVEAMSSGLALFDYDRDGDVDILFLSGHSLCDSHDTSSQPSHQALYRNDGNWHFTDVTSHAGLVDDSFGLGVAIGDYDNDGDADIYLNNYGPNRLYRNNGDGTFTDVSLAAGVSNGDRVGAGTCFVDIEADGDLDLFVGNYVIFNPALHVPRTKQGFPIYGSPIDYRADPDTLFRNNGDGTFTDVSEASGISRVASPTMGVVAADGDQDGDTDIFLANDGQANTLFENDGRGSFRDVALAQGFAFDFAGKPHAGMGVECADIDNDGRLDLHVTSFQQEVATLYRNQGQGLFEDVTTPSGAGVGTRAPVTWGNCFVDFDLDGDRDLFIACGHLYDQVEKFDRTTSYETANLLFENLGNGRFANVSADAGPGLKVKRSSRGAAADDLDNDGDLDLVILNSRREPTILRNETPRMSQAGQRHWLAVTLRGKSSNRDGVGSRVEVKSGGCWLTDERHSGRSYQSHYGDRLYFGLGTAAQADAIRVHWLGGHTETWMNLRADQVIPLIEGASAR